MNFLLLLYLLWLYSSLQDDGHYFAVSRIVAQRMKSENSGDDWRNDFIHWNVHNLTTTQEDFRSAKSEFRNSIQTQRNNPEQHTRSSE